MIGIVMHSHNSVGMEYDENRLSFLLSAIAQCQRLHNINNVGCRVNYTGNCHHKENLVVHNLLHVKYVLNIVLQRISKNTLLKLSFCLI